MRTRYLEIAVDSLADVKAATAGGADRLEVCAALDLGGLTPTVGLLHSTAESCALPMVAMVRPRGGGFVHSLDELRVMARDIAVMFEHGAAAVIFGVITESREIDIESCRRLIDACDGRPAVFHRAFDRTTDLPRSLDALIELGFGRVLTSGGAPTAIDGATTLAELRRSAADRIEILPGGGVRSSNAAAIITATGCDQLHTSGRVTVEKNEPPVASAAELRAIREVLDR
ncbi:MAG: copper homeostasis protein CutC [Phycisphaerae bacterium]